jgi:3-oxoacyl-[acyl-carrier protein] reductase
MKNPTAVVTGASRGLGKAIALAFASVGAKVALLFRRNITEASLVARRIEDQGGTAWAFQCDVADSAVVNQTINDVVRRAGGVDVLVNNAGVSHSSLLPGTDEAIWDDVIATNLTGAFNCTRAVLPCMLKQKRGHIVNIGSLSGMRGVSGGAVYSASKPHWLD